MFSRIATDEGSQDKVACMPSVLNIRVKQLQLKCKYVAFEVFTAVVMKSIIFWDVTPCSTLSFARRFGGTYRLHLQGRRNKSSKPASKQGARAPSVSFPESSTLCLFLCSAYRYGMTSTYLAETLTQSALLSAAI
jgi:hypothetical protein